MIGPLAKLDCFKSTAENYLSEWADPKSYLLHHSSKAKKRNFIKKLLKMLVKLTTSFQQDQNFVRVLSNATDLLPLNAQYTTTSISELIKRCTVCFIDLGKLNLLIISLPWSG